MMGLKIYLAAVIWVFAALLVIGAIRMIVRGDREQSENLKK